LRVDAPNGVGEARSQIGAERAHEAARRDGTEFIEARQFFGGVLEEAEGRGLQGVLARISELL
jgi:hypothetical protein